MMNGHSVRYAIDEADLMALGVARGEFDVPAIAAWVKARMVAVD